MEKDKWVLEMQNVSKSFPGVHALKEINFRLLPGKVHVVMGENGAGKSTLMKIIAGIYKADSGKMLLHGEEVKFQTPRQALHRGIAMIHQELSPVLEMTITENLFLGKEITLGKSRLLDEKKMNKSAEELLARVGLEIPPTTRMKNLSVSQMQMVEIAKALSYHSEIIIMDEPTAAITDKEVEKLFQIIRQLKDENRCIVYISHKMKEIFQIADEITVFRDGSYIGTYDADSITEKELIKYMVDRDLSQIYPKRENTITDEVFQLENASQAGFFEDVSFSLRRGEILGIAGLMGAGRTELMNAVFGITKLNAGKISIHNRIVKKPTPNKMIANGLGYVTEDRKGNGLVLEMGVRDNMILASLHDLMNRIGFIKKKKAAELSLNFKERLAIKTPTMEKEAGELSGGNQQKIVLAKWLMQNPEIIIFDEPTRGIDVGAKTEIYKLITALAEQGKSIIFISSEMPEILGMCDRIIVLSGGKISGELNGKEATQEKILSFAGKNV
ncbi:MAG: sugar ABC transporter ATP-binding protein [Lachnospiraceae bacterium]|nr:sugar ABC transporter ATP-binding protein [Lachnospiraceae bacterium]